MIFPISSHPSAAALSSSVSHPIGILLLRRPSSLSTLRWGWGWTSSNKIDHNQKVKGGRLKLICRADLSQDAPFVAALGACVLNSLLFPVPPPPGDPDDDDDDGSIAMDSTDARFAVMGIISCIPYFDWMGWVFAWLDSGGRQRYLVYAVAYLAPYFRTNLSLSPDESWLPIASILICIAHVQLEASIRNGDLNDIQYLNEVRKLLAKLTGRKESQLEGYQAFSQKGWSKEHEQSLKIPRKSVGVSGEERLPSSEQPGIIDAEEKRLD